MVLLKIIPFVFHGVQVLPVAPEPVEKQWITYKTYWLIFMVFH